MPNLRPRPAGDPVADRLSRHGPLATADLGHFLLHQVLAIGVAFHHPPHLLDRPAQQELDGQPVGGASLIGGQGRPPVRAGRIGEAEPLRRPVPAVEDALGLQGPDGLGHPLLQRLAGHHGPVLRRQALGHPLEDVPQHLAPRLTADLRGRQLQKAPEHTPQETRIAGGRVLVGPLGGIEEEGRPADSLSLRPCVHQSLGAKPVQVTPDGARTHVQRFGQIGHCGLSAALQQAKDLALGTLRSH
jgi:hypothetical protein